MRRVGRMGAALAAVVLGLGTAGAWETAREGTFDGTWTVSGDTYSMDFGDEGGTVTIFRFTGPALIRTANGFAPSLDSECLGFGAPKSETVARCVLTDPEGDRIFCSLNGIMTPGIANVGGRFVGGTGKYAGITGTVRFQAMTGRQRSGKGTDGQTITIFGDWRLP
jgi:hypothetical protein